MTSILHFPPKAEIISYLEKHPSTSPKEVPFLSKNKIIETVADVFHDKDITQKDLFNDVRATMEVQNKNLKSKDQLTELSFPVISLGLTQALLDCANGKPIAVEKKGKK